MLPTSASLSKPNCETEKRYGNDRFWKQCDLTSRAYAILKNGLIVRHPEDKYSERIIEISCDANEAQNLLVLAAAVCPDAILPIEKALASLGAFM